MTGWSDCQSAAILLKASAVSSVDCLTRQKEPVIVIIYSASISGIRAASLAFHFYPHPDILSCPCSYFCLLRIEAEQNAGSQVDANGWRGDRERLMAYGIVFLPSSRCALELFISAVWNHTLHEWQLRRRGLVNIFQQGSRLKSKAGNRRERRRIPVCLGLFLAVWHWPLRFLGWRKTKRDLLHHQWWSTQLQRQHIQLLDAFCNYTVSQTNVWAMATLVLEHRGHVQPKSWTRFAKTANIIIFFPEITKETCRLLADSSLATWMVSGHGSGAVCSLRWLCVYLSTQQGVHLAEWEVQLVKTACWIIDCVHKAWMWKKMRRRRKGRERKKATGTGR